MEKRSPLPKRDGINKAAKPINIGLPNSAAPDAFTVSKPERSALRIAEDAAQLFEFHWPDSFLEWL